jgi:hypothetical protein
MDIWHVENKDWTNLRLWRMDNGDFRVTEAGKYAPIVVNATYTLIDKKYAAVFEALNGQVLVKPTKVHDYLVKTENDSYVELNIHNDINPDTITTLDSSGKKVWSYMGNLFVSGELKNELSKIGGQEITFDLGFCMFAG